MGLIRQKLINLILLPIILLFLVSCQPTKPPQKAVKNQPSQIAILKAELAALNLKNPESDMEKNFNSADKRFISICGYACYCPGADTEKNKYENKFVKQFGSRIINGTSDVIEGDEHGQLIDSARRYAERYNRALLKKVGGIP